MSWTLPCGFQLEKDKFLQSEVSESLLKMDSGPSIGSFGSSRSIGSHTTGYLAAASLAVLLVGWMSPEYAEKFGAFALRDYLSASPLSAAMVVQSSWSVLALAPIKRRRWGLRLPPFGWTWLLAFCLGAFSILTHAMWYKSFTGTTPAINTLVWNLDIVIAMVLEAIVALKAPAPAAVLGGLITLGGASLAMQTHIAGNTIWGCTLCLVATSQYSIIAIITSKCLKEDCPLTMLLALEGVMSLLVLVLLLATTEITGALWPVFPGANATIFMCVTNMMLNFGWLSFSALMGAAQAAMAACLSMPLSLVLDALMLHSLASPPEVIGSLMAIFGFMLSYRCTKNNAADGTDISESLTP
eukprot:s500_g14.t1